MSRVHEVLKWANRRAVAEEVTRRGYRVSGETLNRWVRDGKEFPAVVERIVFDLFTIQPEPALAEWAERLEAKVDGIRVNQDVVARAATDRLTEALAPLDRVRRANELLDRLERLLPLLGEESPEETGGQDPAGGAPQGQSLE